jgi:hypothetical protein
LRWLFINDLFLRRHAHVVEQDFAGHCCGVRCSRYLGRPAPAGSTESDEVSVIDVEDEALVLNRNSIDFSMEYDAPVIAVSRSRSSFIKYKFGWIDAEPDPMVNDELVSLVFHL